jgi:hypothetical protein
VLEELVVVDVVEVVTDVVVVVTVLVGAVNVVVELTVRVGIVFDVEDEEVVVVDGVVCDLLELLELCDRAYASPAPIRTTSTTARAIHAQRLRSFGRRSSPQRGQNVASVETRA